MSTPALHAQLKLHEGTVRDKRGRFIPYMDCCGKPFRMCTGLFGGRHAVGILTIGWGHNLESGGLSDSIGEQVLLTDEAEHITGLLKLAPWVASLDDVRQRVLIDMAFNMGPGFILQWPNFSREVQHGAYAQAAENMRHTQPWYSQVKSRGVRLAYMMEHGRDPKASKKKQKRARKGSPRRRRS